jgi:hypothetical protein
MRKILAICSMSLAFSFVAVSAATVEELKATYDTAIKAAVAAPSDYSANWKAAQAARKYGDQLVSDEQANWKPTAKAVAKDGMKYGEIAFKLNDSGIEGWYWYGLCVGTYADCVSILTALAEGLKDKTQKGFENAYRSDKLYDNGGPILALGRFWQTIPGIAGQDRKKAEQLFSEYIELAAKGSLPDPNTDAWYFRGELYKDTKRADLARADLSKAVSMGNKDAKKVLDGLK